MESLKSVRKLERPRPLRQLSLEIEKPVDKFPSKEAPATNDAQPEEILKDLESLNFILNNGHPERYHDLGTLIMQVCDMLKTKGSAMDSCFRENLDKYFVSFHNASRNDKVSSCNRLRLLEIIELRAMGWKLSSTLTEYYKRKLLEQQQGNDGVNGGPKIVPTTPTTPVEREVSLPVKTANGEVSHPVKDADKITEYTETVHVGRGVLKICSQEKELVAAAKKALEKFFLEGYNTGKCEVRSKELGGTVQQDAARSENTSRSSVKKNCVQADTFDQWEEDALLTNSTHGRSTADITTIKQGQGKQAKPKAEIVFHSRDNLLKYSKSSLSRMPCKNFPMLPEDVADIIVRKKSEPFDPKTLVFVRPKSVTFNDYITNQRRLSSAGEIGVNDMCFNEPNRIVHMKDQNRRQPFHQKRSYSAGDGEELWENEIGENQNQPVKNLNQDNRPRDWKNHRQESHNGPSSTLDNQEKTSPSLWEATNGGPVTAVKDCWGTPDVAMPDPVWGSEFKDKQTKNQVQDKVTTLVEEDPWGTPDPDAKSQWDMTAVPKKAAPPSWSTEAVKSTLQKEEDLWE